MSSFLLLALVAGALGQHIANPNLSAQGINNCPNPPNVNFAVTGFPPADGSIVAGDAVANQVWQSIQANATLAPALQIQPRPLAGGAASGAGYPASDPDCWWTATGCKVSSRSFIAPDHYTCNEPRTYGLSIDDGPIPDHCALYKLLADNNVTPSLFYIGLNVINNPGSALEGYKLGGAVCVHTWSHHYTTTLSNAQVFAELYYTKLAIKRVIGYTPRCFRPPYGDVDDRVRAIAAGLELDVWIWDGETNDWSLDGGAAPATVQANYQRIINGANNAGGTIVLTHELSLKVTAPFISNFAALNNAFNSIVGAHICANVTHPWAEPNAPVLPSFQHYVTGVRTNNGQLPAPVTNNSAAIYFAGLGAPQNGPDFIDAAAIVAGSSSSSSAPLSTGAIIGIAAGAGALGLILLALAICCLCRRRKQNKVNNAMLMADGRSAAKREAEMYRLSLKNEQHSDASLALNEKNQPFGSDWTLPNASREAFFRPDQSQEQLVSMQRPEHDLPPGASYRGGEQRDSRRESRRDSRRASHLAL